MKACLELLRFLRGDTDVAFLNEFDPVCGHQ
jgi:hypothetical protein